jgi:hypothetical protein
MVKFMINSVLNETLAMILHAHKSLLGQGVRALFCVGLMVLSTLWLIPLRPAQAQDNIALNALTIELWPEYDKPSMLVILRGTLDPKVTLPTTITVHIPAASGGPSAVAEQDPNGQLFNASFTTTPLGETIAVHLQMRFASFQVEYYDPGLNIAGEAREYTFQWIADFPVAAATVRVQEPVDTHDLNAEPPITLAGSSGLGLNYYTASLGALSAGQTISLHLRYSKSTSTLSAERVSQSAAAPTPVQAAPVLEAPLERSQLSPTFLIVAGLSLLSLALISWGMVLLVRNRRAAPHSGNPTSVPRRSPKPEGSARFCTQCGQPTLAGDRFCRNCGAPLRAPRVE